MPVGHFVKNIHKTEYMSDEKLTFYLK